LAKSVRRKPLGQGRIHPSESLPKVQKKNLSAKEEFTQVNPCREFKRKTSRPREFEENLSAKEEFTQVNPCREYERKTSRPREFERKPLGQESSKKTSRPRKNSLK